MPKGSSGDAGNNEQLLQPLQRKATPPPRGLPGQRTPFGFGVRLRAWLQGTKKKKFIVAPGNKNVLVQKKEKLWPSRHRPPDVFLKYVNCFISNCIRFKIINGSVYYTNFQFKKINICIF